MNVCWCNIVEEQSANCILSTPSYDKEETSVFSNYINIKKVMKIKRSCMYYRFNAVQHIVTLRHTTYLVGMAHLIVSIVLRVLGRWQYKGFFLGIFYSCLIWRKCLG